MHLYDLASSSRGYRRCTCLAGAEMHCVIHCRLFYLPKVVVFLLNYTTSIVEFLMCSLCLQLAICLRGDAGNILNIFSDYTCMNHRDANALTSHITAGCKMIQTECLNVTPGLLDQHRGCFQVYFALHQSQRCGQAAMRLNASVLLNASHSADQRFQFYGSVCVLYP